MFLTELTWRDVDALDRSTVVLVPFGALEQHGFHLPVETDSLIASELARRVDAECKDTVLTLPTQWLGLSTHHMDFPGTISASVETYLALATEIISSIAQAGFTRILVLNSHGGNVSALDVVLTKCRILHPNARVVLVTYWNAAAQALSAIRESALGGMGHACELETSLLMAIKPDSVRTDQIRPDGCWPQSEFFGKDMLSGGVASISRSFADISESGAVGDPRTASRDKGKQFLDVIVTRLVALVRELQSGNVDSTKPVGK